MNKAIRFELDIAHQVLKDNGKLGWSSYDMFNEKGDKVYTITSNEVLTLLKEDPLVTWSNYAYGFIYWTYHDELSARDLLTSIITGKPRQFKER